MSSLVSAYHVPKVAGTASFGKFVHVLQLVADATVPATLAYLVLQSGYPRPTVHRIVSALLVEGFLANSLTDAALVLGPRLLQLANRSWGRSDLRLAAADALKNLRDVTGETVHLAVPSGQSMVYIEKLESSSAVQMASRIGTTVCLHATAVGKAYLAGLPQDHAETLMRQMKLDRFTDNTVKNLAALRREVEETRSRGWSSDAEEHEAGIFCFGAAIRNQQGTPVAAISVSTLMFRQKPDPWRAYVQPLLAACGAVGLRLAQVPALGQSSSL